MKAYTYSRWGGPENLSLEPIVKAPLAPRSVRIAVEWAGINPMDWKMLSGMYRLVCRGRFPRRLGAEGSGRIIEVGSRVRDLNVGEPVVFCLKPTDGTQGAWASVCNVVASQVLPLPDGVSARDAAVLPIAGLTAWLMADMAKILPNERVLITGASGGVGSYAVQIARQRGAQVTGCASAANAAAVHMLGAQDFLDYHDRGLERSRRHWDVILDCTNAIRSRALSGVLLNRGGRYIDTDPLPLTLLGDFLRRSFSARSWRTVIVDMQRKPMRALLEALRSGTVRAPAIREIPFEQAADALADVRKGHAVGKNVLAVSPPAPPASVSATALRTIPAPTSG